MEAVQNWLARSGLQAQLRTSLERQYERFLSLPSEFAVQAMNPRILDIIRGSRVASQSQPPSRPLCLDEQGRAIVDALVRDGMHVSNLDALGAPDSEALLADAVSLANTLATRTDLPEWRLKHTLTANADDFLGKPRILRWGLASQLLDIVEAYLGGPAAYDGALLYHSKADGREKGVRVWHRDREDHRMLKVVVYLNDVGDDGGPFQILDEQVQAKVDARISWRYAALNQAKLDRLAGKESSRDGIRNVTGPRGTVIIVDTARFHHRGKPPTRRERSALFYSYFRRSPRHPFCCERSPLSRQQIADLAATVDPRGRDCLLWREQLPMGRRLIPRNRLSV